VSGIRRDPIWVDTHCHTIASYDSELPPEGLIQRAEEVGLDAVVITDHDTVEGAHVAARLATDRDLAVIVGCEVSTADGHLLAIGVEDAPSPGEPLSETAERIRSVGGVAVVPHPFQRSRHGASAAAIENVDGIEVYNAHTIVGLRNDQAAQFAATRGYPAFGGSDAHRTSTVGRAATGVRLKAGDPVIPAAIIDAMRAGRTRAAGDRESTWQYITNLLRTAQYNTTALF